MNLRGSSVLPKVRRTIIQLIIIEYFKHMVSSVGLRKRMMSCSSRGLYFLYFPVTHVFFCFASIVIFVFLEVLSCFFHHPSIDSSQKMPLHPFEKDVLMFRLIKKVLSVDVTE